MFEQTVGHCNVYFAFQTEIVVCLLTSSFWLKWNDSLALGNCRDLSGVVARSHAVRAELFFVLVIIEFSSIGIERKHSHIIHHYITFCT